MILFLWYLDSFTTGSPDHSAVWFLSSLKHLFPEGDDISWGTPSDKSFFSPQLSTFDGSVQECNLAVPEKFKGRQWRSTKPKYVAGRNTRTSLGLKIPEGQRVTALGKGKKENHIGPSLLRSPLFSSSSRKTRGNRESNERNKTEWGRDLLQLDR